jgi:hypothetical protein
VRSARKPTRLLPSPLFLIFPRQVSPDADGRIFRIFESALRLRRDKGDREPEHVARGLGLFLSNENSSS